MNSIVLATINARYIHASLGLRYLYANMGELRACTTISEFTLQQRPEDIAEKLLETGADIIGFGVYIWNAVETEQVMRLLKTINPEIVLIAGGPEISFETTEQDIYQIADHVITGQADLAFADACREITAGSTPGKLISPLPFSLDQLVSPYPFYSDSDLKTRVLYVEASRGCPFKCEFCLSSLDKTATAFDLDAFLDHLHTLIERGAREFKFVDRTFNLKAETSRRILEFFLQFIDKPLFLHFELIPDRLPEVLLELMPKFPAGTLQFEIGIQSFNADVQKRISRKQNHERSCNNIRWIRENTQAHIHADLIFGLPGETLQSFADGFNLLYALGPQEIQVGILKRLRGTPIARHTQMFDMRYMSTPPYRVLSTKDADFASVQSLVRFARYWDLIANSGRFPNTLVLIVEGDPFGRFMQLCNWLFGTTGQTHKIALEKLFDLLYTALTTEMAIPVEQTESALLQDHTHNGMKGIPLFKKRLQQNESEQRKNAKRQLRHSAQATRTVAS